LRLLCVADEFIRAVSAMVRERRIDTDRAVATLDSLVADTRAGAGVHSLWQQARSSAGGWTDCCGLVSLVLEARGPVRVPDERDSAHVYEGGRAFIA